MRRDFTYVDDVCRIVTQLIELIPTDESSAGGAPARIYNVGNSRSEELMRVVGLLEREFGRKAELDMLPMQPGDVYETFADIADLARDTCFSPSTPIEEGLAKFAAWYRDYYKV
jgi:UDP-glucuronate 4-epimerase